MLQLLLQDNDWKETQLVTVAEMHHFDIVTYQVLHRFMYVSPTSTDLPSDAVQPDGRGGGAKIYNDE